VKLAVFDCDGTLADGQAAICAAMAGAFTACGLAPPPNNAVRRIVGLSLPVAVRHLAPDADDEAQTAVVAAYKQAFFTARTAGTLEEPLFEGMAGLIAELVADGWTLGVATGKSDRGLAGLLDTHGLSGSFATLQTSDRHPSKPHPAMLEAALFEAGASPDEAVMIGDTTFDMAMARAAGVRAIGVAWGYHSAEELIAAGADGVAETVEELKAMLDG
jgi:phosphoglycolate phosphatase